MIFYKTDDEIELIRQSCLLVGKTLAEVAKHIKPGVPTLRLDEIAEEFIRDNGAEPGFKNYEGFPYTLCVSRNEEVVHGMPSELEIAEGDILSIDCGTIMNGFYGDSAYTFAVGEIEEETRQLMEVTKEALYLGVENARIGKRLGDIGFVIQNHTERKHGYNVVREMVGHGLGRDLHEKPEVNNFGKRGRGQKLLEGLVIAIEPMINMGTKKIIREKDGWTVYAADKKPSAHFEHAVAIRREGPDILSSFDEIEKAERENQEINFITLETVAA